MLIGFFKAIGGLFLIGLLVYVLWSVVYVVFALLFALAAVLLKWLFACFLILLAFAAIFGMLKALIKG